MILSRTIVTFMCLLMTSTSMAVDVFVVAHPPHFDSEELNVPALTPYEASYQTSWRIGWFSFDIRATQRLVKNSDDTWQMEFNARSRPASMTETSIFRIENQQLQPLEYRFRSSGMLVEPNRTVTFDWDNERIIDHEQNTNTDEHWQYSLHDNLTFMQQVRLDLANGFDTLEYSVYEKNRIRTFHFERIAEERLKTEIGELDTVKIQQIRSGKRTTYAWFAKDYDYLLVRLSDHDGDKKRTQIDIRSYSNSTHQLYKITGCIL